MTQDVRYAFRSLLRAPGFTLVALLTLSLGIGSTTAIFSVVNGILLRPLPYPDPHRIVSVSRRTARGEEGNFSAGAFLDYRKATRSFDALAGYRSDIVNLTGTTTPTRLDAVETTIAFFDVFGLPPLAGRVYSERTDSPHGPRLAVISENTWRQRLGSDPTAIGRSLQLNGVPTTVIGVMPAEFVHPSDADIWVLAPRDVPTSPVPIGGDPLADYDVNYFLAIGRLRSGVTVAEANDDVRRVDEQVARARNDSDRTTGVVEPYQDTLVGDVRNALLVLLGAVGFVLLIACANVTSLLLARGAARRREFAVRSALGAGRSRLIRQLLTESVVLATAGGLLGLLLAYWGVDLLLALAPESIPRLEDVRLDPAVTMFAIATSAIVGVLFGTIPAFHGARREVTDALKDGGRTGTSRTRAQKVLVVAEVGLALVLLIGAGLMLTSFARLRAVDVGFVTENLVLVGVPLPQAKYNADAQARFYTQLYERLQQDPSTARSAIVFPAPFSGGNAGAGYVVQGSQTQSTERPQAQLSIITPGYFATLGVPILRGRDVELRDTRDRPGVVVVNQTLAEREWPGEDPIGKRLGLGSNPNAETTWLTVVGVVADSKRADLEVAPSPSVYLSHNYFTLPFMGVVARTTASEAAVADAVRAAVRGLDPELPITDVETVDRLLQRVTGQPRFRAFLVGAFALAALVLAAVGLYGLISYTVAQRAPEIGVRLALGATPRQVGNLVLGQGLALAVAGVVVGLAGAWAATRLLEGLLFSISATDPVVYSGLAALLLLIAGLASFIPARRAMRVDPMTALRAE